MQIDIVKALEREVGFFWHKQMQPGSLDALPYWQWAIWQERLDELIKQAAKDRAEQENQAKTKQPKLKMPKLKLPK